MPASVIAAYEALDLPSALGRTLAALPWSLRVLAENVLRHADADEAANCIAALEAWCRAGSSTAEIAFRPDRVLMHDTTCGPALVDIAAMRDVIAEAGGDPRALTPLCPVHAVIDHSLGVDRFGAEGAMAYNARREIERNAERYRLASCIPSTWSIWRRWSCAGGRAGVARCMPRRSSAPIATRR
jgi:aconitate hydratase A / 2-methylisocitrate dehydratase